MVASTSFGNICELIHREEYHARFTLQGLTQLMRHSLGKLTLKERVKRLNLMK